MRLPAMEDYLKFEYLGDSSSNGEMIAWAQSHWDSAAPLPHQRFIEQIHLAMLPREGSAAESAIVTAGGQAENSPHLAADGTLYFLSDAALPLPYPANGEVEGRLLNEYFDALQLYRCSADGSIEKLSHMRHGVNRYWVSRDQSKILLECWQYAADADEDMTTEHSAGEIRAALAEVMDAPIVIEGQRFKSDAELGYSSRRSITLWLLDLRKDSLVCLLNRNATFAAPMFNRDESAVICQRSGEKGLEFFCVPFENPEEMRILATVSNVEQCFESDVPAQYSADGQRLIFAANQKGMDFSDARILCAIPAEGGEGIEARILFDLKRTPDGAMPQDMNFANRSTLKREFLAMPDGHVYYVSFVNGCTGLYRVRDDAEDAPAERVLYGNFHNLTYLNDRCLLACHSDAHSLPELVLVNPRRQEMRRISHLNPWLDEVELSRPRELWVDTLDGTDRIQGWVLSPLGPAGESYPAILYCHGGPTGCYSTALNYEFQALAAAGFAVIFGNPRGGTGYGREHGQDHYAYDNSAMYDVIQLVDEACRILPGIDQKRTGICGGSYGGYLTTWTAAHSRRFKAACAQRPLLNLQMILYSSHSAGGSTRESYEGFRDYLMDAIKDSAGSYGDRIEIPFQIQVSEKDANCVPEQSYQLFAAIRETHPGLPCRLAVYPDSCHGLLHRGPMYLAVTHRKDTLEWFRKYL